MIESAQATTARPYADSMEHLLAALSCVDLRVRWGVARARAAGLDPTDEFRGLYVSDQHADQLLDLPLGAELWSSENEDLEDLPLPPDSRWSGNGNGHTWPHLISAAVADWQTRTAASRAAGVPLRLADLAAEFELTGLELEALLLALAPEIDLRYERLFAYLQDDVTKKRPSVNLILNLIAGSFSEKLAMRGLFTDEGRLIQQRLLVRFSDAGAPEMPLLAQYVRPPGRVVEHLLGHPGLDSRLAGSAEMLVAGSAEPPVHMSAELQDQLVRAAADNPLFAFIGPYGAGKRQAARYIAAACGNRLMHVDIPALNDASVGLYEGLRLALRDARLLDAVLYLAGWDMVLSDGRPPQPLLTILLGYPGVVITAGEQGWQPADRRHLRPIYHVEFSAPGYDERLTIWQHHLPDSELDLLPVAAHFRFTPGQIADAVDTAHDLARWRNAPLSRSDLFAASRTHSNQRLSTLATKITPRYGWQDIVLPADTLRQLQEVVNTVEQRPTVYGRWGFGRKLALGKGTNALFAGESGTGKTMSADIIAGVLGLDLYKIDLSSVVSKYIGETEKNLDKIFTEAATSNAILFFDEADAIFGKRSEVKDSHDRYANIETGYLLQRMEAFDGVVILATNLQANLDDAFIRRLHFIIDFPFPEAPDRERIWRVTYPADTPLAEEVDFSFLARQFRIAGGNIKNIVVASAFLAARDGAPVGMRHILHAARREYQKLGRLIDESKFGWPQPN